MTPISSADLEDSSLAGKCTLSSGVEIKGSITFQKELVIDGTVQGKINSNGVLTIGENGDVRGEIKAKSVTVYGKVHGTITAERCELKSKCTLEGDLKAARLVIEEGATFPLPVEWQEHIAVASPPTPPPSSRSSPRTPPCAPTFIATRSALGKHAKCCCYIRSSPCSSRGSLTRGRLANMLPQFGAIRAVAILF